MNARHFAEVIQRNAERLLRLVGDLLFLSQMQTAELTLEVRDTDLAGVAAEAVAEMWPEARRKHIELTMSVLRTPPPRGPDADSPAPRQPHLQRGEVHPGGREGRGRPGRRGRRGGAERRRHRHRHPGRRPGADLRAVLPHRGRHPAGHPGQRPRAHHLQGDRRRPSGQHHRAQRRGPRQHLHRAAAAGPRPRPRPGPGAALTGDAAWPAASPPRPGGT